MDALRQTEKQLRSCTWAKGLRVHCFCPLTRPVAKNLLFDPYPQLRVGYGLTRGYGYIRRPLVSLSECSRFVEMWRELMSSVAATCILTKEVRPCYDHLCKLKKKHYHEARHFLLNSWYLKNSLAVQNILVITIDLCPIYRLYFTETSNGHKFDAQSVDRI